MADSESLRRAITQWVEWYRSINNPDLQRRVAEKNIAMQVAQENAADMTFIDGWRSNRQVIVRPPNDDDTAWARLTWAMRTLLSKVPVDVERQHKESGGLRGFVKGVGEARAQNRIEERRRRKKRTTLPSG